MSRDTVLVTNCDNDENHQDGPAEGATRKLDLGGGEYEVELCEECTALLVSPLEKVVQAHGRPLKVPDGKQKLRCPWCPRSLASPRNLRDHIDTTHPENAALFLDGLMKKTRGPKVQRDSEGEAPVRQKELTCRYGCGKTCHGGQGLAAHERWCEKGPHRSATRA